jgi:hypothetical protein
MAIEQITKPIESSNQPESAMTSEVFHYSAWRFLHTMFAIAWSAFAHPFSTTVIDLTTGEMRHESGEDEA